MPTEQALSQLVGMQGQAPTAPYIGLWSRLADFAFDDLSHLISRRGAAGPDAQHRPPGHDR